MAVPILMQISENQQSQGYIVQLQSHQTRDPGKASVSSQIQRQEQS